MRVCDGKSCVRRSRRLKRKSKDRLYFHLASREPMDERGFWTDVDSPIKRLKGARIWKSF